MATNESLNLPAATVKVARGGGDIAAGFAQGGKQFIAPDRLGPPCAAEAGDEIRGYVVAFD
jgi:hypothetical protein